MGEVIAAIVAVLAFIGGGSAVVGAIQLIVTIATTAYSYKKAGDQKAAARKAARRAAMESQQRNSFRNFRQPLTARRQVYGRCRVAGPFIFAHNPNEGTMAHLVVALAGHEIDAIEAYYILNDQVPVSTVPGSGYGRVGGKYANNVIIWPYLGTAAQDIGARMRTATDVRPGAGLADISLDIITEDDKFSGIACLYVVTNNFGADLEGAQPDFAALVRGKKFHDPRIHSPGVKAWSENPALAAADYLTTVMGFPWSSIDPDTLHASADACDELIPLADAAGTQKRYTIAGVIDADTEHREALDLIADTMAGAIRYSSGRWFIEAGMPKETSEVSFHENNVLAPYDIEIERPDRTLPNAVRGNFYDEETSQPMSFPQYILSGTDPARMNWLDVELPLVKNHVQAQRIGRIMLGQARASRTLSLEFDLRGMLVRPGDVVPYTSPELGIDAELFLVDGWTLSQQDNGRGPILTTRLDLIDYDPAICDWDPETDEQALVRGTVNLVPIRGKEDFGKLIYTETDSGWISRTYVANYNFEWFENLQNPEILSTPVQIILTITVIVDLRKDRSSFGWSTTVTATIPYTGGGGSHTLSFTTPTFASGTVFVSRTLKEAHVQVVYADGTIGAPIDATYVG